MAALKLSQIHRTSTFRALYSLIRGHGAGSCTIILPFAKTFSFWCVSIIHPSDSSDKTTHFLYFPFIVQLSKFIH